MSTTHRGAPEGGDARALQELRERLAGRLVEPGDPGYDRASRSWSSTPELRPRAAVRAGSVEDIDLVVAAAQRLRLPLAVRSGGYGMSGPGTVGSCLVLDLGRLRHVVVDPANQLVSVEPGSTLGGLDRATTAHGLAVPVGTVSTAGIAGLALGGGMGWLTRSSGLTLDTLDSADVVTAAGDRLHASQEENAELFWGLRGGGGNFGVVSSFTFSARRMPALVLAGTLRYRRPHWRDALRAFTRWSRDLPDELTSIVTFTRTPPGEAAGDEPWLAVGLAWVSEDHAAGRALVDALRAGAPPDAEDVGAVPWLAWQSARDGAFPKGSRGHWQNLPLGRLDDEVVDAVVRLADGITDRGAGIDIHHLGGAFGRVAEESTAFPNRSAPYWVTVHALRQDSSDDERLAAFTRTVHAELQPFAEHGQSVDLIDLAPEPATEPVADAARAARRAYGREKLQRLVRLKDRYDPDNLFRVNLNVPPSHP